MAKKKEPTRKQIEKEINDLEISLFSMREPDKIAYTRGLIDGLRIKLKKMK